MSSHVIPLVYLIRREALSSVFASQVLTPLEMHRGVARVTLGLLTPIGHLLRRQYCPALQNIDARCREAGIQVGWIPSPPSHTPWLWSEAFLLRQWISKRFSRDQSFIVRCRNSEMTTIAIEALQEFAGARIVFDCRGAEVTQLIQKIGLSDKPPAEWNRDESRAIAKASARERRAVTESAGVTCVSQALARILQQRYPDVSPHKFRVVPCCPDVDSFRQNIAGRAIVRKELGIENRFVVTYLGSLVWYQKPEASLRLFRLIQAQRPDAHFLAITTEPDKMQRLATQAGISPEAMTIRSVPAHEVPRLLVAADLGLMLRDDTETNRVASPIKLGEYLAAGVPVLITPGLGDYSDAVREHRLGVEVDLSETDAQLTERLRAFLTTSGDSAREQSARCTEYAEAELAWSGVIPRLADWYSALLEHSSPALSHTSHLTTGGSA